jgi:hypothetical protein
VRKSDIATKYLERKDWIQLYFRVISNIDYCERYDVFLNSKFGKKSSRKSDFILRLQPNIEKERTGFSFVFGFNQITIAAKTYEGFVNSKFSKNPRERKNVREGKEGKDLYLFYPFWLNIIPFTALPWLTNLYLC